MKFRTIKNARSVVSALSALCGVGITGCQGEVAFEEVVSAEQALGVITAPVVRVSANRALTACLAGATCSGNVDGKARQPRLSADGNKLAFFTRAVSGQANIYLDDLVTGARTAVVSLPDDVETDLDLSDDGRYIAFANAQGYSRIDVTTGARVNIAQPASRLNSNDNLDLSGDGRYLAFTSSVAHVSSDTNAADDVYVYDFTTATFERASLAPGGTQIIRGPTISGPQISGNGRYVSFRADNKVDINGIFTYDRVNRTVVNAGGFSYSAYTYSTVPSGYGPRLSADGRWTLFQRPSGWTAHMLADSVTGARMVVPMVDESMAPNDPVYQADLSPNGRYAVFSTRATNLGNPNPANNRKLYIQDLHTRELQEVSSYGAAGGMLAADPVVAGNRVAWLDIGPTETQLMVRALPSSSSVPTATVNHVAHYRPSSYAHVSAVTGSFVADMDGASTIAAISGSGTLLSPYGGTESIDVQLSLVNGQPEGYVWIDGSLDCGGTEMHRDMSYNCTPGVFWGGSAAGIDVSSYHQTVGTVRWSMVGTREVFLEFAGPIVNGDATRREYFTASLPLSSTTNAVYGKEYHIASTYEGLISSATTPPAAASTARTSASTHFTLVKLPTSSNSTISVG
ncbi:MAG: PD40 domain-containing protein, partial [Deltaproteobacteria bacterium]|nr:PD40 domain-containing protein [Deltaproteobacteria bacterium]